MIVAPRSGLVFSLGLPMSQVAEFRIAGLGKRSVKLGTHSKGCAALQREAINVLAPVSD